MRGRAVAAAAALVPLLAAAPAAAQEPGTPCWAVGAFGGRLSGGVPVGSVENLFFRAVFEQGADTVWGLRGGVRLWRRLAIEAEAATSSPGLTAVLSDLAGRERTEAPFAELELHYGAASLRFDLAEARARPFLLAGLAWVWAESDLAEADDSSLGMLFGGGIEVALLGPLYTRLDVRGLRSGLELLGEASADTSTTVLWTLGLGLRF